MIDWISGLPTLLPTWSFWLLVPITIAAILVILAVWKTTAWFVFLPVPLYIAAVMLWPSAWLIHWVFWVPFVLGLLILIWIRWLGLLLIAIAGIAILVLGFIPVAYGNGSDDPRINLAVCEGGIIPEEAQVNSDAFIANSLPSSNLLWSDSVSTPFAGETPEEKFGEVLTENGGNPTMLLMNVEGLSSIVIDEDGTTIGDINPCFGEFIELAKAGGGMDGGFLTDENTRVVEAVTDTAERVNTLLLRLRLNGITVESSTWNWHVAAREGLAAGKLPIATLNDVEEQDREFLRLEYVTKTGECLFAIGYNTGDKRLVGLPCVTTPPPGEECVDCGQEPPCVTDCPKYEEDSVDPIQGVDPQGPGIFEPTAPPSPTPGATQPPGSDPSPEPSPSVPIVEEDQEVIPTPEETTTPIDDPDA